MRARRARVGGLAEAGRLASDEGSTTGSHLTMHRVSLFLTMAALAALAACSPRGKSYGPVNSRERAIEIAKAELNASTLASAPFQVEHKDNEWIVKASRDAQSAELSIDEKTGRVTSHSEDIVDVAIIKPVK